MTAISAVTNALLEAPARKTALAVLGSLTAALLAVAWFALVLPDASYTETYLNDVFGLTDGAYRVFTGQIPSVDFHTLYGAAVYYPAALGFQLGFSPGGAPAFGHFITAVPLLLIATLACYRRLPLLHAVILIVFLFLLIVVPMRVGGEYSELTYGIFYTRHGWAALTIALLFYLEPRTVRRGDLPIDAIALSLLLLYLLYLKITFATVAVGFVIINMITSRYKFRLSSMSLLLFGLVVGAITLLTDYNQAYLGDIREVVQRNSIVRNNLDEIFVIVSDHLWMFLLCMSALATLYLAGHRKFFDIAFVAGCIVSSIAILDQSGGTAGGLPPLLAVFLVCGELARRNGSTQEDDATSSGRTASIAALSILGMLLAFVSEPVLQGGLALTNHYIKTTGDHSATMVSLSGHHVGRVPPDDMHSTLGHCRAGHGIYDQLRGNRELNAREYMPLVIEGIELLEEVPYENRSVITFEHTNPFPAMLGMRPTRYGYPLLWANMMKLQDIPDPSRYFSDTDYVMVPEIPYSKYQLVQLNRAFGAHLEENFTQVRRSTHWRLYERN